MSKRKVTGMALAIVMMVVACFATSASKTAKAASTIRGFDASYVSRVEAKGGVYLDAKGKKADIFAILKSSGVNYVRLRVWNNPSDGYCSKADVLALAKRAYANGLNLFIDFHYSDSWADGSKQTKPTAWSSLSYTELKKAVYDYTYDVCSALVAQGTPAAMVQIGNEIQSGFLWDDGYNDGTTAQYTKIAELINAGATAAKAANSSTQISIQYADSNNATATTTYFNGIINAGAKFDQICFSYYPLWHGSISTMQATLTTIKSTFGKPVFIAETSYPFTLNWNDWTNNIIGLSSQLLSGYSATEAGQKAFLTDVFKAVNNAGGLGAFTWGGEWIATGLEDTDGSTWENQALFNFSGKPTQALLNFSKY